MTVRIWGELSPQWKSSYQFTTNRRSRDHRLFRRLGGFCGMVREERAWIKGLGRESKELWKVE